MVMADTGTPVCTVLQHLPSVGGHGEQETKLTAAIARSATRTVRGPRWWVGTAEAKPMARMAVVMSNRTRPRWKTFRLSP